MKKALAALGIVFFLALGCDGPASGPDEVTTLESIAEENKSQVTLAVTGMT